MSLQRRRERYCIIHTWKILNDLAPNDISLNFNRHDRHGIKITLPPINHKTQASVRTDYENSFKIKAARLWNLLPQGVNSITTLDAFKAALGSYLKKIPEYTPSPSTPGYTAANSNRNSLLDWSMNSKTGFSTGGRTWYCCPDASPAYYLLKCMYWEVSWILGVSYGLWGLISLCCNLLY